jgi:hypothetical protein
MKLNKTIVCVAVALVVLGGLVILVFNWNTRELNREGACPSSLLNATIGSNSPSRTVAGTKEQAAVLEVKEVPAVPCDANAEATVIGAAGASQANQPIAAQGANSAAAYRLAATKTPEELADCAAKIAESGKKDDILALFSAIEAAAGGDREILERSLQFLSSPELSDELLSFLIRNVDDPVLMEQARDALSRVLAPEDIDKLSQALPSSDDRQHLRSCLLDALSKINNPATVDALGVLWERSKDVDVKSAVTSALGVIGTPEAVASLVSLIEKSGQEDLNSFPVRALMSAASKDSRLLLQDEFMGSTNSAVKYATAYALTSLNNLSSGTLRGIQSE